MNKLNHITKEKLEKAYLFAISEIAKKHGVPPTEVVNHLYEPIYNSMVETLFPKSEIKATTGDLIEFDDVNSAGVKTMSGGPRYYMVVTMPNLKIALINIKTGGILEDVGDSIQKIIDKSWLKNNNRVRVISNSEYNKAIKF